MNISIPFVIGKKMRISENIFQGGAIYSHGININFNCIECENKISFILQLEKGIFVDKLFTKYSFLEKDEMVKRGVLKKNFKMYQHLGEFSIFPNLPVYYKIFECPGCKVKFIIVYAFGESQPGRDLAFVSGVWKLNEDCSNSLQS